MRKKKRKQILLENIEVLRAGAKGVSIGKTSEGQTILIEGAVPGDVVNVMVYKKRKSFLQARVTDVVSYSPHRVTPKCEHFGVCGGCKWQNLNYDAQLKFKQDEVKSNLIRIGGFENLSILPILGSEDIYYYRNKLEFSFSNSRWLTEDEINRTDEIYERDALGFHIPGQWSKVLDIKECHLQESPSNEIRLAIKKFAIENNYEFFDLRNQQGFLRTMMLRSNQKGEFMVLI